MEVWSCSFCMHSTTWTYLISKFTDVELQSKLLILTSSPIQQPATVLRMKELIKRTLQSKLFVKPPQWWRLIGNSISSCMKLLNYSEAWFHLFEFPLQVICMCSFQNSFSPPRQCLKKVPWHKFLIREKLLMWFMMKCTSSS